MIDAALAIDFSRLPAAAPILVGLSGGLDSTVLLDLLAHEPALLGRVRAIHVHHGLHGEADAWAAHCESACAALGVPLRVVRVEVDRSAGLGLEGAARAARHAAFAEVLHQGEALALAHHRDDQAETFLFRALRASGPDGLGSMRPWRRLGAGWLWRPLLEVSREALFEHARHRGLAWIDDPSNAGMDPDRNFLRHRVLPVLRERWPHADAAFARCATLAAEAADLLGEDDASALANLHAGDPAVLDRVALRALAPARRARVLRRWIDALGLPPLPAQGIARLEADVLAAAPDAQAAFAWHGACIRAWRNRLHAGVRHQPLARDWHSGWNGTAPLHLPTCDTLRLEPATGFDRAVSVHARRGGERIRLPGRTRSHALKHVLQDRGMPPWERERLPLLRDNDGELLAAGDAIHSAAFAQWLRETGTRLVWEWAPAGPPGRTTR